VKTPPWLPPAAAALAVVATFAGASALRRPSVRVEVGGFDRAVLAGDWPRAARADVDADAARGGPTSFYHRAAPWSSTLRLPLVAVGPVTVAVRAATRIRSAIAVSSGGVAGEEVIVPPGRWERYPAPWDTYAAQAPAAAGEPIEVHLGVRSRPLVGRIAEEAARPELLVDSIEVSSPEGLRLSWRACLVAAAAPALAALLLGLIGGPLAAAGAAIAAAVVVGLALPAAPVETTTAIPRLAPFAVLAGLAAAGLARGPGVPKRTRAALAALTAASAAAHGAVVFFPNHNPPDLDIHVRRTLDLASVPAEYGAWLRYGSQLPTASQDIGAATAALGERTLIPYSPLPYVFYDALHRAGLDLFWAMTAANAALTALLAPLAWLLARRLWGDFAGGLAAILAALDLALWHHVGRSHAPAVFGAVLAGGAMLHLARRADAMHQRRASVMAAALLALAALGYSSAPVFLGLFGAVLLALFAVDAAGLPRADRAGLAAALVAGGLLAGALFYFHYVPGLLAGGRGIEAEPDLFPGRTFFVFHNESRQSLRLWALGLWIPLAAGAVAAPVALRRAPAWSRPVLLAWAASWALVMLLKEPFLLPRLLRWAKEDLFLAPLVVVLIAGAVAAIPSRAPRWAAAAVVVAVAAWLQVRDFAHHASSLRL
jgi:hypothetical protein